MEGRGWGRGRGLRPQPESDDEDEGPGVVIEEDEVVGSPPPIAAAAHVSPPMVPPPAPGLSQAEYAARYESDEDVESTRADVQDLTIQEEEEPPRRTCPFPGNIGSGRGRGRGGATLSEETPSTEPRGRGRGRVVVVETPIGDDEREEFLEEPDQPIRDIPILPIATSIQEAVQQITVSEEPVVERSAHRERMQSASAYSDTPSFRSAIEGSVIQEEVVPVVVQEEAVLVEAPRVDEPIGVPDVQEAAGGGDAESFHTAHTQGDFQSTSSHSVSQAGGRGRAVSQVVSSGDAGPRSAVGEAPSISQIQPTIAQPSEEIPQPGPSTGPAKGPATVGPPRIKVVKRGTKGEIVNITTNFIRLGFVDKCAIYEYHVDFVPPLDSTIMKKHVMRDLMREKTYTFDGTMMFTAEKKNGDILEFVAPNPNDPDKMLDVKATFIKEKFANSLSQFINILFKGLMKALNRVQLKDNYYDVTNVKSLPQHRLDIWPGYCISVEEQEGGLMCCLDASHRVLRQDTVLEQYRVMKGQTPDWKEKFAEFMVGKIVLTRYNNASYKIDDIWWDATPTDTFEKRGKPVSYLEYYKEHYGISIMHKDQPMLVSRIKPRRGDIIQEDKLVALVPELCFITGLTEDQRSNFNVMKDLGEHTRLSPAQRKIALEKFIQEVNGTPSARAVLAKWNLQLENAPVMLEGRMHAGPTLNFGKRDVIARADFSRDAMGSVVNPATITEWLMICTQRDADKARRFVDTYRKVCGQLGIKVMASPVVLPIKGYQINDFRRAIKDNLTNKFQFLFVLMPQQRDDVYSMIKKLSISELEIPSQCCLTKTLSNEKKFNSVVQKIALQINCKLGGALWSLVLPFDTPVMFVGIDVAHDPKKKSPSVLGLVSTLNNECTKYVSICRTLKVHQETADTLESAFVEALETYNQSRGCYPVRVIIWRDGGLADPTSFNQHEVQQLQSAVYARCLPDTKFSFVVVQKRIPQRFFMTDKMGRNWENPQPGTVIDHTVTKYDMYDFYVVSQLVRQGTVTPTHYTVISDVGDTKPDLLQKFAYVSSFMYYNWPGTVRVPAMTQYAHKLASLVGSSMRATPGQTLRETLYYL